MQLEDECNRSSCGHERVRRDPVWPKRVHILTNKLASARALAGTPCPEFIIQADPFHIFVSDWSGSNNFFGQLNPELTVPKGRTVSHRASQYGAMMAHDGREECGDWK